MEYKETIIFFKETFWQSIISDAWTFAGILLCIWFSESNGSVFWLSVSCVGLLIWMMPFKPHQKKFRSRTALHEYLTGDKDETVRVLLEPGVWLVDDGTYGDPARTTKQENATLFPTDKEAIGALCEARTYRPFAKAVLVR